jgi:tetratricopeptide (TPR) repeat protein
MVALLIALAAIAPQEKQANPVWPNADPAEPFKPAAPVAKAEEDRVAANKSYAVAMLRLRQDRWAEALQDLRDALKKLPTHLPALKQASLAAAQLDRRDEALDYCRRTVALDPTDADRLYLGGIILAATGKDDEALAMLEKARDLPKLQYQNAVRYVSVREALVDIYDRRKAFEPLAKALGDILEVTEHPDNYNLDQINVRVLGKQRLAFHLKRAEALRQANKYDEAQASLLALAKREPNLKKRILVDVAQVQLEAGRPADALKTLEVHFAFGDSTVKVAFETIEKAYSKTNSKELLPRLERLVKSQPSNSMASRIYAFKLFDAGEFKRAEEALRQLHADRETIPLLLRTYIKLRNAPMLFRTLQRLLQNRPGDDEFERIAQELTRDRDLINLVAKEAAGSDAATKTSAAERERLLDLVAYIATKAGQYAAAAELYGKCVEISPQAKEHRWQLTLSLLRAEKFAECVKAADEALAVAPDDVDLSELKASALARLGKTAEAVKLLEDLAARTKNPDQLIEVKLAIAGAFQQGKELAKAVETYRAILDEFGPSPDAHRVRYLLSGVYSQMNDNKKAEEELLKIVEANPRPEARILAGANNDLGFLWVDEGRNLDRAERMIRDALKNDADNPAYLDSLGWALFKRGRNSEAKDYLQRAATAKSADDPVVWDHLGDVNHRLGDRNEAVKAWRTAMQLYDKGSHGLPKEKGGLLRNKVEGYYGKDWDK